MASLWAGPKIGIRSSDFAQNGSVGGSESPGAGGRSWVCAASSSVHALCACETLHCPQHPAQRSVCLPVAHGAALCAVYDVAIGCHPACTCPDCGKGNICKHILFVLLRVLHLPTTEPLVWQKALLPSEVDEVRHRAALG